MFPNAGAASTFGDKSHPYHGQAFDGTWIVERQRSKAAELRFMDGSGLWIARSVRVVQHTSTIEIHDLVGNASDTERPFSYGHHIVFPLDAVTELEVPCDAGAQSRDTLAALLAANGRASHLDAHVTQHGELVSVVRCPSQGFARVTQGAGLGSTACVVTWDTRLMPYLWLWLSAGTDGSFTIGVEPVSTSTVLGLAESIALGEAQYLRPGARVRTWIRLSVAC